MGLSCQAKKPSRWTSPNYKRYRANKLNQQFNQQFPNKVWASDFTYIKIYDTFYFLCVVIDLFSRKVISYHLSNNIDTDTLMYTFEQAYITRNYPDKLWFHNDQGIQYVSYQFRSYLRSLEVAQSFSGAGYPYDNSVVESFFAFLKKEELFHSRYKNRDELEKVITDYIIANKLE